MQLYSYDVFDTILYRNVPQPYDVFIKMACTSRFQQILTLPPKHFAQARSYCESLLRHIHAKEITIEEVYAKLRKKFKLSRETTQKLQELEFEIERKSTFLNQKVVKEISLHLLQKDRVILISDMYWSGEAIRRLLAEKDEIFQSIPIYASSDWNASKAKGSLFSIVRQKEKYAYREWRHIGDNPYSDGKVPCSLGIQCTLVSRCFTFDFEKLLNIEDKNIRCIYETILEVRQQSETVAYRLGASFASPMVYQYVEWVLTQAMKCGIQILYFVLRDGYILQKVAQEIINSRDLPIKAELLFGSRVAWRLPEVTVEQIKSLSVWEKSNWIFRDPAFAYVPFERLGFNKAELTELFGSEFARRKLLSFRAFKETLNEALQSEPFCNRLKEKVHTAGENLAQYLQQTLDESKKIAFVDTNSTGKTQCDLNAFRAKHNPDSRPIVFFYHTYLSDEKSEPDLQHVFVRAEQADRRLPEALFRAPYLPCYGYKKNDDGVMQPKFFTGEKNAWYGSFSYDEYLEGIIQFTRAVEQKRETQGFELDSYIDFLVRVANFDLVSKDELRIVGRLPFNPDLDGNEVLDFYPQIHCTDVFHPFTKLIYLPKGSFYRAGGFWPWLYKLLFRLVSLKRKISRQADSRAGRSENK